MPIGREHEAAELQRFVERIGDSSQPVRAALIGAPGVGKTAMWRWCVAQARAAGMQVISTRCSIGPALPFRGLADLLDGRLEEVRDRCSPVVAEGLLRCLPPIAGGEPGLTRSAFWACLQALEAVVRGSRTLVAIDDVESLDPETADVVRALSERLGRAGLGILTTSRGPAWRADPDNGVRADMVLRPLEDEDVARLISSVHPGLRSVALAEVVRRSRGNPLLALELAKASLRTGAALPGLPLSELSAGQAAIWRVSGLPADALDTLLVVSLAGRAAPDLVEEVLGADSRKATLRAIDLGVLQVERGALVPSHPLLAEAAITLAPAQRIRAVHGDLADFARDELERATHLALSNVVPNDGVAERLVTATHLARQRGATLSAAELAEHAVRLTPADSGARSTHLLLAADAAFEAGDVFRSQSLALEGLTVTEATPPTHAHLVLSLARALAFGGRWPDAEDVLASELQEARLAPDLRARLEYERSLIVGQFDVRRATDLAIRATTVAQASDSRRLAEAARDQLRTLAFFATAEDDPRVRTVLGPSVRRSHSKATLGDAGLSPAMLTAELGAAVRLKSAGRLADAARILERARLRLSRSGGEGALGPVLFHCGELACWSGDLAGASMHADELGRMVVRGSMHAMRAQVEYLRALTEALGGDLTAANLRAQEWMERSATAADQRQEIRHRRVAGLTHLAQRDWTAAVRVLTPGVELARSCGFLEPGYLRIELDLVEALSGAGDLARSAVEASFLDERARYPWTQHAARLAAAIVCANRGDVDAAVKHAQASAAGFAAIGHLHEQVRALTWEAAFERRRRQRGHSAELLREASTWAARSGIQVWHQRIEAERARLGQAREGLLSPTESRIADAIVRGLSNAEVAADTGLSIKTIEGNLTRIYRKLGVRSRTGLARNWREATPSNPAHSN